MFSSGLRKPERPQITPIQGGASNVKGLTSPGPLNSMPALNQQASTVQPRATGIAGRNAPYRPWVSQPIKVTGTDNVQLKPVPQKTPQGAWDAPFFLPAGPTAPGWRR